jgi:hypothetical protein
MAVDTTAHNDPSAGFDPVVDLAFGHAACLCLVPTDHPGLMPEEIE